MPGKHNAGGCGCCTLCWDCDTPLSITVDGGIAGIDEGTVCCTPEEGTYTFPAGNNPSVVCFPEWGSSVGSVTFGTSLTSSGDCSGKQKCPFTDAPTTPGYYLCKLGEVHECGTLDTTHLLFKVWNADAMQVTLSGLTVNVTITTLYEWWVSSGFLALGTCSYSRSYVEIIDEYEQTYANCGSVDGATISHVSRTRINTNLAGTFGGTGNEIIWGPSGSPQSYIVCPPKLLSLNMP